ncbi:alpha/beta hydrolase [Lentzea sp. NPDC059081]|uniref:alpha/beta hydrolase n=1 Tax=Lentzea sp. NPDC059081 TaxID=3346719 RepID=UPI0036A94BF0
MLAHGGEWAGWNWRQLRAYANWLADNGYRAICVTYRLAPPARWDVAPFDVLEAMSWVEAHVGELGVDPSRIALFGSSAGGTWRCSRQASARWKWGSIPAQTARFAIKGFLDRAPALH